MFIYSFFLLRWNLHIMKYIIGIVHLLSLKTVFFWKEIKQGLWGKRGAESLLQSLPCLCVCWCGKKLFWALAWIDPSLRHSFSEQVPIGGFRGCGRGHIFWSPTRAFGSLSERPRLGSLLPAAGRSRNCDQSLRGPVMAETSTLQTIFRISSRRREKGCEIHFPWDSEHRRPSLMHFPNRPPRACN